MVWPSLSRDLGNAYDESKKKKRLETDIGQEDASGRERGADLYVVPENKGYKHSGKENCLAASTLGEWGACKISCS